MKRLLDLFNQVCGNRYFPFLFPLIAFVFLSVFSWSTSPFFVHDGCDSAVFKTMGLALLKGKVLYKDIFDHKGPILYFINALGQWLIPGRLGIFLLQLMGLSIALFYMFRTAKLFVTPLFSFISMLLALSILGGRFQEGNQCEEWMMYVICIVFYYVCNYFVNKSEQLHSLHYSLIYGLCFGFVFFIRPNDAVAWIGGSMLGVTLWLLYHKHYRNAVLNALCFVGGFVLVSLPVFIYFGVHHAISDMWYGLVVFNQEYSGGMKSLIVSCLIKKGKLSLELLFVMFLWLVYGTKHEKLLFFIFPACCMGVLLMGVAVFPHYSIPFTPFWVLFFVFFIIKSQKTCWTIAVLCLLLHLSENYWGAFGALKSAGVKWNRDGMTAVYQQSERLFAVVPEPEKDSIWNYNLRWKCVEGGMQSEFSVFCHDGIVQCNKITFGRNSRLKGEDALSSHAPKWILYCCEDEYGHHKTSKADSLFIAAHYDMVEQSDTTICKLILYKRR